MSWSKLFGKVNISKGGLVVLSNYHAHTHEGKSYTAKVKNATLGAAASLYIQVETPDDGVWRHLKGVKLYTTGSDASFELNESPTLTTGSAAVAAIARNRAKVIPSDIVLFSDPTGISAGIVIDDFAMGTGSVVVGADSEESDKEFVLAPNTRYLLTLTNDDVGTQTLSMRMNWYE